MGSNPTVGQWSVNDQDAIEKNKLAHRSNWWLKAIRPNRYCWENSCWSKIWSLLKISFGIRGRLARERSQRPNLVQRMLAEHSLNSRLPNLSSTNLLCASGVLARLYGTESVSRLSRAIGLSMLDILSWMVGAENCNISQCRCCREWSHSYIGHAPQFWFSRWALHNAIGCSTILPCRSSISQSLMFRSIRVWWGMRTIR